MSEAEEFEFRARAEAEAEQAKQAQAAAQSAQATAVPGAGPVAPEPGMMQQASDFITQKAVPVAFGVGKAGMDVAGQALGNPLVQKGLELAGGGYAAKRFLVNPVLEALKPAAQAVGQQVGNVTEALNRQAAAAEASERGIAQRAAQRMAPRGPMPGVPSFGAGAPGTPMPTNPYAMPSTAPVAQPAPMAQQPSMLQRGMDMANRMRQAAAQRVLPAAGVPGAVAAGGAAATGIAGGQMAAMTPEQRRAYYDNMMLGAMGGDAGLAAAIMNRGQ